MPKGQSKIRSVGGRANREPPDFTVSQWNGLVTSIKDTTELPDGATPDALNWITGRDKDHIEIRRGFAYLGKTIRAGASKVTGLGVASKNDGTQVPFFTYDQKIMYYDSSTNDTLEVSTDVLPAIAKGEDVAIMPYQNIAGSHCYFTSPNSSIYKIEVPNPTSIIDLNSKAFRGKAKIDNNRMFMWDRRDAVLARYPNDLLIGVSDKSSISNYTQTQGEDTGKVGTASALSFSGTTGWAASNSKNTGFFTQFYAPVTSSGSITGISAASQAIVTTGASFAVGDVVFIDGVVGMTQINNLFGVVMAVSGGTITLSINSSTFTAYSSGGTIYKAEYFYDDRNGVLKSNLGGTGTINYATGAWSVTFNTAPLNSKHIYASYYVEDATSSGVADFTVDGATSGKGKIFPQFDGGGALQAVFPFDQVQYCFHLLKTWYLTLFPPSSSGAPSDVNATNLPYRSGFGIPYWRAGFPTPDGILVLDNGVPSNPKVKILQLDNSVAASVIATVPDSISDVLDLSSYGFGLCVLWRWGEYDIMACENVTNGVVDSVNTLFFIRNTVSKQWDLLKYPISCLGEFNGTLVAGSSISSNVLTLFSGLSDGQGIINNYWKSKLFNLRVEGIKKFNRFVVRGLIQQTQNIEISFSFDSGNFIKVFTVQGTGSYVNLGNPYAVGSSTVGSQTVGGGGGLGPTITAYPFEVEFEYASDIFEYVQVQFAGNSIGFAQINLFTFKDIRYKGKRLPATRIVATG